MSGPLICEKALRFHELLGDFKPGTGWPNNVKARHGIQELYVEDESLSSDCYAAVIQDDFDRQDCDETRNNSRALLQNS